MGLSLAELVAGLPELNLAGNAATEIRSVTADSRSAGPGILFVAVKGTAADGHDFIAQAVAAGSPGVVLEKGRLAGLSVAAGGNSPAVVTAARTRHLPALLARRLARKPDRQLLTVGVTGTNGKTTVAFLLQGMLGRLVGPCGLLGTIRYDDGHNQEPAPLTTPSGPVLYDWLQRMVDQGCRSVAMEVSSHALEQERVAGLELDTAVMTNIGRDHLDYHADMESYVAAKALIKERLVREGGKGEGTLVLNGDDPRLSMIPTGSTPVLRFHAREGAGSAGPSALQLVEASVGLAGTSLEFFWAGKTLAVDSPLVGRFNVENLAAALASGIGLGLDPQECAKALGQVSQVPGRLERFDLPSGGLAVVDYAHTPDGLAAVLATCRELGSGRLLLVFGCGGDRDRGKRPLMGEVAAQGADAVWITSDNPRSEDPEAICAEIAGGWTLADRPRTVVDRTEAIAEALAATGPGEVVVIAGKGHENFQLVGDRRLDLEDRAIVNEWIKDQVGHA